jgi:hypothetical protein
MQCFACSPSAGIHDSLANSSVLATHRFKTGHGLKDQVDLTKTHNAARAKSDR